MRSLPVMLLFAFGFAIPVVQAESAASYCNEMYPPESYEADERGEYISDCLAAYGEDEPEQVPETEHDDGADDYYDRTVEEYVDSVDTDTELVSEDPEPAEYDADE